MLNNQTKIEPFRSIQKTDNKHPTLLPLIAIADIDMYFTDFFIVSDFKLNFKLVGRLIVITRESEDC